MTLKQSSDENELISNIRARFEPMKTRLKAWSEINSGSYNTAGLKTMRAALHDAFDELGANISDSPLPEIETVTPKGEVLSRPLEPSLEITQRPDAEIQLVMTGHYDTVFPANYHFQTVAEVDADTWNGPGLADMKGGILVLSETLRAFEQHPKAKNVGYTILLSPDEEIGSPGSAKRLAELGAKAHVGLTYEPSLADGSLAGARKGSGNFTAIFHGRAAHAGREHHLGRNAITAAARFSALLDSYNGKREGVTFNVAKIDGGGASNIVPEMAVARFNVRMQRPEDMAWIEQRIDEAIKLANDEDGIHAHLHGGFTRPPKPMSKSNATVFDWVKRAGAQLGQEIKWSPSGGVCEGNNLYASGCPNVDTLGVRGGEIHSDREFIILPSLVERAQLSALILMKIADGTFDARSVRAQAEKDLGLC